jgi:hypothetical protein
MADYVNDVLSDPDANNHPWRPGDLVKIVLRETAAAVDHHLPV